MRFLLSISLPIKPIAVILVASGQGLTAVSRPRINAVSTGTSLLSSHVCRKSIAVYCLRPSLILSRTPFLNSSVFLRAFLKENSVMLPRCSLPPFQLLIKSDDHVTR